GIQTSGFLNVHAGNFNGFQISAFGNFSKDLNGFQIAGFVNKARKVNGFQIGFINIADSVKGIPIGFLNIVKHGIHSLEFGYNEMNMVSGLFRTGIYGFHNVFYGAVEPVDGKKEFAVGYGLGSAFKPSKQTMVDFTALVIQRSQNNNLTNNVNLIFRASPHLAFGFNNGPYVYFGPSFNVFITQPIYKTPDISIGQISPKNYYSLQIPEDDFRSWAGFDVGIRF